VRVPLALLLLAVSCGKGKPTPSNQTGSADSAKTNDPSKGSLVPQPGSNVAPDIVLPHGPGTPPIKDKPVDGAKIKALSQLTFAGFNLDPKRVTDNALEVTQRTDSRPRLQATVFIEPCKDRCTAIDLDKWKAKGDTLKVFLMPDLRTAADTTFEVGQTELNGAKMIFTYQLGFLMGKNDEGAQKGLYSNAYVLYFNDDVNQITVVTEFKDQLPASRDALLKLAPRADLEKVAKAFLDVYTQAW
jgi:hypothetical protein